MIKVVSSRGRTAKIFDGKLFQIEKLTKRALYHVWHEVGKDLEDSAKKEILRHPKAGRKYVIRSRSGRRRRHIASAPGETHAEITGKLRRSIGRKVTGWQKLDFGYIQRPPEDPQYGEFLEFGTSRMAARPTLLNAINDQSHQIEKHFATAMKKEFG